MANDANQYPMPAFYFSVAFTGIPETSFLEVSGISSEIEIETVREGGENRFSHQLPKSVNHGKLVVKRGIAARSSQLLAWCANALDGGFAQPLAPKTATIKLLDMHGAPSISWTLTNVYPVKWEMDGFNSTKNDVAIESITFVYNTVTRG